MSDTVITSNPLTGTGTNPLPRAQQRKAGQYNNPGVSRISFLVNSYIFFLDTAFILYEPLQKNEPDGYRLVVIHNRQVLTHRRFPTLEQAKQSFRQDYKKMAFRESYHPCCWDNHPVENDWLKFHLDITRRPAIFNSLLFLMEHIYKHLFLYRMVKHLQCGNRQHSLHIPCPTPFCRRLLCQAQSCNKRRHLSVKFFPQMARYFLATKAQRKTFYNENPWCLRDLVAIFFWFRLVRFR